LTTATEEFLIVDMNINLVSKNLSLSFKKTEKFDVEELTDIIKKKIISTCLNKDHYLI
jgi:hypothetical protein